MMSIDFGNSVVVCLILNSRLFSVGEGLGNERKG